MSPFTFRVTLIDSILVSGYCPFESFSYALTTSQMFRSATDTEARASISTPVFSWADTVTVTCTQSDPSSTVGTVDSILSGCESATIEGVCLTARTADTAARVIGSPFSSFPFLILSMVAGFSRILPVAVASLWTTGFSEMSTCLKAMRRSLSVSDIGSTLVSGTFLLQELRLPVSLELQDGPDDRLLRDRKGRIAKKLRISVTDRCNFACLFCMPDKGKVDWIPTEEILNFDEIERVTRVLASLGIEKVRVTGGEPLLRPGIEKLVGRLAEIQGIESVDMTTNGWFLEGKAQALREAGLRGVTVSLHSLRADRFAKISGIDALPRVLKGIDRALDAGLSPVKVNSVAIKGYNDDEVMDLVEYARERRITIRFIEFMPLDGLGIWNYDRVVSGKEILRQVSSKYPLVAKGRGASETAANWRFQDGVGGIGLITPMSEPFCDDCDRIRLTSDGKLLSCLFDTEYHDLRTHLRNGASERDIADKILKAVWKKPDGVGYMPWIKGGWEKPRNMNAIGG